MEPRISSMIRIAEEVYRIPTLGRSAINSFLFVEADGSLTLVDAGLKGAPKRILRAVARLGKQPSDVRRMVLTHAHVDHAGGLARLRERTGARILAHAEDARYVRDGRPPPQDARTIGGKIMRALPGKMPRCEIDEEIADGQMLDVAGGLRVLHTPGHTPGHVALLHEPTGLLITGDALFNVLGLRYPFAAWCSDAPLSRETADRLGEADYEIAGFMHGPEIRAGAREKVRAFLAKRAREG